MVKIIERNPLYSLLGQSVLTSKCMWVCVSLLARYRTLGGVGLREIQRKPTATLGDSISRENIFAGSRAGRLCAAHGSLEYQVGT